MVECLVGSIRKVTHALASFSGSPPPLNHTASNGKLGEGLGMRLQQLNPAVTYPLLRVHGTKYTVKYLHDCTHIYAVYKLFIPIPSC